MFKLSKIALAIGFAVSLNSQVAYRNVAKQLMRLSPTLSRSTVSTLSMPLYNTRGFNSLPVIPGSRQKLYNSWRPVTLSLQSQSALNSSLNTYRLLTTWDKPAQNRSASSSIALVTAGARTNHNSDSNSRSNYKGTQSNIIMAATMAAAGVVTSDEEKEQAEVEALFNVIDKILDNIRTMEVGSIDRELKELEQFTGKSCINRIHSKLKCTALEYTLNRDMFKKDQSDSPAIEIASYLVKWGEVEITLSALESVVIRSINPYWYPTTVFFDENWIKLFDDMLYRLNKSCQKDRIAAVSYLIKLIKHGAAETSKSIHNDRKRLAIELSQAPLSSDLRSKIYKEYLAAGKEYQEWDGSFKQLTKLNEVVEKYHRAFER